MTFAAPKTLRSMVAGAALAAMSASAAFAQTIVAAPPQYPSVNVTASATATVPNDRIQAWLRSEAESVEAAAAANQVNAAVAKAIARAKGTSGVTVTTSGYSTQQIAEKGKPTRWRVTQSINVASNDFAAVAALLTRLQEQDGMLLSGMGFSLSANAREGAERQLMQQAIRSWQSRAQQAASGLGSERWRTGHVTVQTSEPGRVYPMARAASAAPMGEMAPVNVEAGTTDVTVTVTGDAILDAGVPPR
jgi:predicted secreted protein